MENQVQKFPGRTKIADFRKNAEDWKHCNMDKTEYTSTSKSEGWKEVEIVGSLIDDDKDVERGKQLATVALYKLI